MITLICPNCGKEKKTKTYKKIWCDCNKDIPFAMVDKNFQKWVDKKLSKLKQLVVKSP